MLTVDPVALRACEPRVNALAGSVDAALGAISAALRAQCACWGADEPGRHFGQTYEPAARATLRGLGDLATALRRVATALLTAADNADAADDRAVSRFEQGAQ